jgi:NAD(P)-dependent dehydrogenase (short-subunit alcohol dehydrogenase family)
VAAPFFRLLWLVQAMGEHAPSHPIRLLVVTNGVHDVVGGETPRPDAALVLGPCRVAPLEHPGLTCQAIDVDGHRADGTLADRLLREAANPSPDPIVAYRGSHRWLPGLEPVRLGPVADAGRLRPYGVYVITGGLGGIGSAIAEFLARSVQARLVLIGRTGLPPREDWSAWCEGHDADDPISVRIARVRAIEDAGGAVLVVAADVADERAMREAFARGRAEFGEIHGVVHAAGVPGGGVIQLKRLESALAVLRPKVLGTRVLQRIVRDAPVDFVALFSSELALFPTIGQVDYCAANAFLDASTADREAWAGVRTVSIDWGAWEWDAWQRGLLDAMPALRARVEQFRRRFGMRFDEGVEALARVLDTDLPHVVVSPVAPGVSQQALAAPLDGEDELEATTPGESHDRPVLATPYVAPRDETEERVAAVWAAALAIDRIGVHDNFLELGGHSLLATQVISRLRDDFGVDVSLNAFFEEPTVAGVAAAIRTSAQDAPDRIVRADDVTVERAEEVLRDLDALSDDEVDRLLGGLMSEEGAA